MGIQTLWDGKYESLKTLLLENKSKFYKAYTKEMEDFSTSAFLPDQDFVDENLKVPNYTLKLKMKWAYYAFESLGYDIDIKPKSLSKFVTRYHKKWWLWYVKKNNIGGQVYLPKTNYTIALQELIHRGFIHRVGSGIDLKTPYHIKVDPKLGDLVYPKVMDCQQDALQLLNLVGTQGLTGIYTPTK